MSTKAPKSIAIIGAGIVGMNIAWNFLKKGYEVKIFEKRDVVGGVGTSVVIDGNAFDYGPHLFHTAYDDIFTDFKYLMGDEEYVTSILDRRIKYRGVEYTYPLKIVNVLKGLGFLTSVSAGISFIYSYIKRKLGLSKIATAEDWFIAMFGKVGYKIYFKDYTEKVWGVSTKELSELFTSSRIPTISIRKLIKEQFVSRGKSQKQTDNKGDHIYCPDINHIHYPKDGIGVLQNAFKTEIEKYNGSIYLNAEIHKILMDGNEAKGIEYTFQDTKSIENFDIIISTIPLKGLMHLIDRDNMEEIREVSSGLKYRAVVVACLVINKPKVIDSQFLYFYNTGFNRITEPKNVGLQIKPDDKTVILAEYTCNIGDELWNDPSICHEQVVEELVKEGLFEKEDVYSVNTIQYPHAYPLYEVGYEKRLKKISELLNTIPNIFSIGRQGLFTYIDMDICMKIGKILVDHIDQEKPKSYQEQLIEGEQTFF